MSIWSEFEAELHDFRRRIRELPVHPSVQAVKLRRLFAERYSFKQPVPLEQLSVDLQQLLRKYTTHITHPRYFGLFNPSVREAAILGDAMAALYNPQLAAWSHAPAVNELEQHTLRFFTRLIGWDASASIMNFTSGGAEANLSAALAAIAHCFPESSQKGIAEIDGRPLIYLTTESHHSFVKIARMCGLGTQALREIPPTSDFLFDTVALSQAIRQDRSRGHKPFMVVGTAGTTSAGLIDPLPELQRICREEQLWFHVDAAWGGGALMSSKLRPLLTGIESADSLTWDAHKWLSVPMGAGMFFCRRPQAVQNAFSVATSYMPEQAESSVYDPYTSTAQWSRRSIGLKVFMALAELGEEGYAALIEHQADMGSLLREKLLAAGWKILNRTGLPVVCFTRAEIEEGRATTAELLNTIYRRNHVWISATLLGNQIPVLRACITSYLTDAQDLDCLVDELEYALEQHNGDPE